MIRWTTKGVFGKANMNWNMVNEDFCTSNIILLNTKDVELLKDVMDVGVEIVSDTQLVIRADNGDNPSKITVLYIDTGIQEDISIGYGGDWTFVTFGDTVEKIICRGNQGSELVRSYIRPH